MRNKSVELIVGMFMLAGMAAILLLALKVSGLNEYFSGKTYDLVASFDGVGGLKPRAPVKIAGVKIGQVGSIDLNQTTFKADVTLQIYDKDKIPTDSSASILTAGLLGANYISITPGFDQTTLKSGETIEMTQSALVLENLIGQMIYKTKGNNSKKK